MILSECEIPWVVLSIPFLLLLLLRDPPELLLNGLAGLCHFLLAEYLLLIDLILLGTRLILVF
jgi:hypothetical protein